MTTETERLDDLAEQIRHLYGAREADRTAENYVKRMPKVRKAVHYGLRGGLTAWQIADHAKINPLLVIDLIDDREQRLEALIHERGRHEQRGERIESALKRECAQAIAEKRATRESLATRLGMSRPTFNKYIAGETVLLGEEYTRYPSADVRRWMSEGLVRIPASEIGPGDVIGRVPAAEALDAIDADDVEADLRSDGSLSTRRVTRRILRAPALQDDFPLDECGIVVMIVTAELIKKLAEEGMHWDPRTQKVRASAPPASTPVKAGWLRNAMAVAVNKHLPTLTEKALTGGLVDLDA